MNLSELIAIDPDTKGYASMTNAQIAADLINRRHTARVNVSIDSVVAKLRQTGAFSRLLLAVQNAEPAAVLLDAQLSKLAQWGIRDVDLDAVASTDVLAALQAAGTFTPAEVAEVNELGNRAESLAERHLGCSSVFPEDVQAAKV